MAAHAHDFVVVIPVADRPRHLADCLASLFELRRRHAYAGAVEVLIVDDSLSADHIAEHRDLAEAYTGAGQPCHHLDRAAQDALRAALPEGLRARLKGVLGPGAPDSGQHNGASVSRNLASLWLLRHRVDGGRRLFWFIDSDQEFRVSVDTPAGEARPYAIDYLTRLDRLFSKRALSVVTGKVVGDPPVSPAVMAGRMLDDIDAFLAELATLDACAPCTFHAPAQGADDAAYHDMSDLFGFPAQAAPYRYRCALAGAHDHAACCADFAARLGHFFDGAHPTRRSHYVAAAGEPDCTPARTVYTGNYVLTPQALEWFIPFAGLGLRMAGPTLGRIVRAEAGAAFVSANLPMLHQRIQGDSGRAECRPGVRHAPDGVDLSGEYERQFYGDVMLFSVERLSGEGYPARTPEAARIAQVVDAVEGTLRQRYLALQAANVARLDALAARLDAAGGAWARASGAASASLAQAHADLLRFLATMRANFGADGSGPRTMLDAARRESRLAALVDALAGYPAERDAWRECLASAGLRA